MTGSAEPNPSSTPFIADADFTLHVGDVRDVLAELEPGSVDCVITSPPYWGLRDYGTGEWDGGNPDCDHKAPSTGGPDPERYTPGGGEMFRAANDKFYQRDCGRCGARRVDNQIGLEPTPDLFVQTMVDVFRAVRRVLADHGTCWINLGDSYAHGQPGGGSVFDNGRTDGRMFYEGDKVRGREKLATLAPGLKPKDLCMIPARVALALQQPYYTGQIASENDRTWLAAIIDGEGSIALNYLRPTETNERNHDYYGPYLRVHNTCEAIVRRCAQITGLGSVKVHDSRRRPVYVWAIYGVAAREILREVYPHLVAKQHEARLAYHAPGDAACYAALKLLHRGSETTVDRPAPPSCWEPGWYLRSDIIWSKPNPMPESVSDRPTSSYEHVFLLTKQPHYWFDAEAVREPHTTPIHLQEKRIAAAASRTQRVAGGDSNALEKWAITKPEGQRISAAGRNVRNVWEIATQPYAGAHFATYPEELVRRCLLAGCPEWVCRECGKPRERIVAKEATGKVRQRATGGLGTAIRREPQGLAAIDGQFQEGVSYQTIGWSDCGHGDYRPGVVLDPFIGSGTTALVARNHGRHSIGIELNPGYATLAARRLQQLSLLA